MSAPVPSTRRLAVAIGVAATSITVAIGVTAASLFGWFRPAPTANDLAPEVSAPAPGAVPATPPGAAPATPPVILVPIVPTPAATPVPEPVGDGQLAFEDGARGRAYADRDEDDRDDHDDHDDHDREDDHDED